MNGKIFHEFFLSILKIDRKNHERYSKNIILIRGGIMNTQKVAITIPKKIVIVIDMISKEKGISRSRYISNVL